MRTENLALRTAGRELVRNLNWQVGPGECWCVIGRNGAGKSTLLRTLAGLRPPESGSVLLDDKPLPDWPLLALARRRAWLPQGRNDAFGYRAIDTVLAARHPYHDGGYWEGDEDYRCAQHALLALDAAHLATRDVRTLSGGERQRVAIAAVLAQDTPLLLLDEPAGALDLAHQVGVMALIDGLIRERKSVILVSHDLNMAQRVATHALLLMEDGAWRAGPAPAVMRPDLLGACLGYPVEAVSHEGRTLFIPREDRRHA